LKLGFEPIGSYYWENRVVLYETSVDYYTLMRNTPFLNIASIRKPPIAGIAADTSGLFNYYFEEQN